jgi:hypothetical protein
MLKRLLVTASLMVFALGAHAREWRHVTTCGEMQGVAYFFPGGAVPKEEAGWDDMLSDGTTYLVTDGKEYDVLYKDASGQRRSARSHDGAKVVALPGRMTLRLLIISDSEPRLEQYTFQLDERGKGTVILSQQHEGLASNVIVARGQCVGPDWALTLRTPPTADLSKGLDPRTKSGK